MDRNASDFALGMAAFLALFMWNVTPWLVVVLCALAASGVAVLPTMLSSWGVV
jgi:hypothetical protein